MASRRPNLLYVLADQWRRQAVGCMGADPVVTPHMDRFAGAGTVFENAFACNPLCGPNRAALLTGRHPFALGMMRNWLPLPSSETTIASAARADGYATAYIGKWHLDEWDGDPAHGDARNALTPPGPRRMGFAFWHAHGIDHRHFGWRNMTTDGRVVAGDGLQPDHETDVALDYLANRNGERDPTKPFCLFLSWSPPHDLWGGPRAKPGAGRQYAAPERFEALYRGRNLPMRPNAQRDVYLRHAPGYFGAVSWLDENFGRLIGGLDALGLSEDTIVALSADHGELLGSHRCMIKDIWYEESIGIPFLIRWPARIPSGRRVRALLNTPDIMPSLLGLMGCPRVDGVHGEDLSPVMIGAAGSDGRRAFLSFDGAEPGALSRWPGFGTEPIDRAWRGVRSARHTYVAVAREKYGDPTRFRQPLPEGVSEVLFDLENDPYQVNPIYRGQNAHHPLDMEADHDAAMDALRAELAAWLRGLGDPFLEGAGAAAPRAQAASG